MSDEHTMPTDDVLLLEHGTKNLAFIDRELWEFTKAMQAKLNSHRQDRGDGWKYCSIISMYDRLQEEVAELTEELGATNSKGIQMEAVDVANFAMFVYALARWGESIGTVAIKGDKHVL